MISYPGETFTVSHPMTICDCEPEERKDDLTRAFFSLGEVAILADVPEKRVRKDIETGILKDSPFMLLRNSRRCFHRSSVLTIAAVYGNSHMPPDLRREAIYKIDTVLGGYDFFLSCVHRALDSCRFSYRTVTIDRWLRIDINEVFENIRNRVDIYSEGLARIEEKDDVLGGEAVFKDSRLPVRHVGKMVAGGEPISDILEDYPYLTERDVLFAELYHRAHPPIGRPRERGEAEDAADHDG
jgi:uncharacterized protein (DUF433 family)